MGVDLFWQIIALHLQRGLQPTLLLRHLQSLEEQSLEQPHFTSSVDFLFTPLLNDVSSSGSGLWSLNLDLYNSENKNRKRRFNIEIEQTCLICLILLYMGVLHQSGSFSMDSSSSSPSSSGSASSDSYDELKFKVGFGKDTFLGAGFVGGARGV